MRQLDVGSLPNKQRRRHFAFKGVYLLRHRWLAQPH